MHEFNINLFTEIGKVNNSNGKTVFIKFFSGHNGSIFTPDQPINKVCTTLPCPEIICTALLSLKFVVEAVSIDTIIWKKL